MSDGHEQGHLSSRWTGIVGSADRIYFIGLIVGAVSIVGWFVASVVAPQEFVPNVITEFFGIALEVSLIVTLLDWLSARRERKKWEKATHLVTDDIVHHLHWTLNVVEEFEVALRAHSGKSDGSLPYNWWDLGNSADWTKKEGRSIATQHLGALAIAPEYSFLLAQTTELCGAIESACDQVVGSNCTPFDLEFQFENICVVSLRLRDICKASVPYAEFDNTWSNHLMKRAEAMRERWDVLLEDFHEEYSAREVR